MWGNGMSRLLQPPFAALRSWKDIRLRIDWYLINLMTNCLPINKKAPRGEMLLLQLKTSKLEIAMIDWISEGGNAGIWLKRMQIINYSKKSFSWLHESWVMSLFVASNKLDISSCTSNIERWTSKGTFKHVFSESVFSQSVFSQSIFSQSVFSQSICKCICPKCVPPSLFFQSVF